MVRAAGESIQPPCHAPHAYVTSDCRVWCQGGVRLRTNPASYPCSSDSASARPPSPRQTPGTLLQPWCVVVQPYPRSRRNVSTHTAGQLTAHSRTCSDCNIHAGDRICLVRPPSEVSRCRRAAAMQRVMATFDGWVNSVHYNISAKVGDLGAVFAADRCAPLLPWPLLAPLLVFYAVRSVGCSSTTPDITCVRLERSWSPVNCMPDRCLTQRLEADLGRR